MAAIPDTLSNAGYDLLSVRGVAALIGVARGTVFNAVNRGYLHPIRVQHSNRFLIFRSEVYAWRHRYTWRPTPEELATLVASGYKAEDFTPATPGELAASAAPSGGAGETFSALISVADARAYVETVMRESQALATSAAPLAGNVVEGAMRAWLAQPNASDTLPDMTGAMSSAIEGVMRPITETISASVTPISEALAQAALPRPAPLAGDVVARQMNALRMELAQLLTRLMDAIRPMVERLAAGGYVTPDDIAPFMALMGELTSALAGSPFYEPAREAIAQIPDALTHHNASPMPTPTPDGVKVE